MDRYSSQDPHELPEKFENIFVYSQHVNSMNGVYVALNFQQQQHASVILKQGINIRFGDSLRECIVQKPVVFSPYKSTNIEPTITDFKERIRTSTYNTGTLPLERNEKIAVVPPMCDCAEEYKINGVIPLQTVSIDRYSAALNHFFLWIKGIQIIKEKTGTNSEAFKTCLTKAFTYIKHNYLVCEMMEQITVRDGKAESKIMVLYETVVNNWLKPLFGTNELIPGGTDICRAIDTTLRVLNDTDPQHTVLFQLAKMNELDADDMQEYERNLNSFVYYVLKLPEYYDKLTQYYSSLKIPEAGIIWTSFDRFKTVECRKKMIIKQI